MADLHAAGKDWDWLQHDLVTPRIRAGEFIVLKNKGDRGVSVSGCAETFSSGQRQLASRVASPPGLMWCHPFETGLAY